MCAISHRCVVRISPLQPLNLITPTNVSTTTDVLTNPNEMSCSFVARPGMPIGRKIHYPLYFYVGASIANTCARFAWLVALFVERTAGNELAFAMLEVGRRSMWSAMRVEVVVASTTQYHCIDLLFSFHRCIAMSGQSLTTRHVVARLLCGSLDLSQQVFAVASLRQLLSTKVM